jgi:hypothetical protein
VRPRRQWLALLCGPSTSPLDAKGLRVTLASESTPAAVFSPRQIALAAFIGTPLAACLFFRRNYLALGDELRAARALWVGLAATVVVFAIASVLPEGFPNALLPILYTAAADLYASAQFRTRYDKYLADGGRKGSWWIVVGVSLLALLVIIGVLFAVVATMQTFVHR